MREQTLDRLIRIGLVAVVVLIGIGAVGYVIDRLNESPSLLERETSAAEAAVRKEPDETGLRLRLAEVYRVADRPDDALTQYDEVLKLEAEQGTALLGRGEVLAETGERAEAVKSFRKAIKSSGGGEFAGVDPLVEASYYGVGSVLIDQCKAKQSMTAL
jgi:tetratricopeptide (TPR) repeat protein